MTDFDVSSRSVYLEHEKMFYRYFFPPIMQSPRPCLFSSRYPLSLTLKSDHQKRRSLHLLINWESVLHLRKMLHFAPFKAPSGLLLHVPQFGVQFARNCHLFCGFPRLRLIVWRHVEILVGPAVRPRVRYRYRMRPLFATRGKIPLSGFFLHPSN